MVASGLFSRCRLLAIRTFLDCSGIRTFSNLNAEKGKIFASRVSVSIAKPDHTATIAVINLNDHETRNSLSKDNVYSMLEIIHRLQDDEARGDPIRALVLKSNVANVFCAGANLKERQKMTRTQVESWLKVQRSLMDSLDVFPYPTIAAIDGHALGGGLELALACDMRIIHEKAKVGLVETRLAIIPGAGGTQRLTRLIGVGKAKEHIFIAEPVDANEAHRLGIANHTVNDQSSSFEKAIELAEKMCKRGPKALRLAKAAIAKGSQASLNLGLDIENAYYGQLLDSEDRHEGMKAFIEKREPLYTGN